MPPREYLPFDIGRLTVMPGHRPHTFKVLLAPQSLTARGVLEHISQCFRSNNSPILSLHTSILPDRRVWIYVSAHIDGDAGKVAECLSKVDYVQEVEYSPPIVEGVGVDAWGFPPILGGTRILAFREPVLAEFLKRGWRLMGGGFGILLYYTFFKAGQEIYRTAYSMLKRPEDAVRLAEAVFRIAGYGALEVAELTDTRAVGRVYDSIECKILKDVKGAENSIVRGIIAGFVAGLWGLGMNDVAAAETKCIRRGDPYCEIVVEKRPPGPLPRKT